MNVVAVIGARLNSSRLEGKHLLDLAGKTLVQRVIDRLRCCNTVSKIVLATTADAFNQPLLDAVNGGCNTFAYSGDVNDLMGRINGVVENETPDYIIYICGDCPLIEPKFIDHAILALQKNPTKQSIQLKPSIKSIHEGILVYSLKGWETLSSISTSDESREHIGLGNKLKPSLNILEVDDCDDYSHPIHRISVDTVADYEFMRAVYESWYQDKPGDTIVDLKWVQQQLTSKPQLAEINKHVKQKNPEQQYQKVTLYCHASRDIGMGHLRRCSTIAQSIQENLGFGTEIVILGTKQHLPWLNTKYVWLSEENKVLDRLKSDPNKVILLDLHPDHINMEILKELCSSLMSFKNIIALDKLTELHSSVNALFIPGFYSKVSGKNINSGWKNYLIDVPKSIDKKAQLVVLTGGSDVLGYGESLPSLIESVCPDSIKLIWVQGPYASPPKFKQSDRWSVLENPPNVLHLIAESQIAVTAYGLSLFECLAAGCATFLLPPKHLADTEEIQALQKEDVCVAADSLEDMQFKLNSFFDDETPFQHKLINANKKSRSMNGQSILCDMVKNYAN